jgi:hypothetical protein
MPSSHIPPWSFSRKDPFNKKAKGLQDSSMALTDL